jgi:hypothetical protein
MEMNSISGSTHLDEIEPATSAPLKIRKERQGQEACHGGHDMTQGSNKLGIGSAILGAASFIPSLLYLILMVDSMRHPGSAGDFQGAMFLFYCMWGAVLLGVIAVICGGIALLVDATRRSANLKRMIPAILGILLGLPGLADLVIILQAILSI